MVAGQLAGALQKDPQSAVVALLGGQGLGHPENHHDHEQPGEGGHDPRMPRHRWARRARPRSGQRGAGQEGAVHPPGLPDHQASGEPAGGAAGAGGPGGGGAGQGEKEIQEKDAEIDREGKIAGVFCKAYEKAVLLDPTEENVRIWAKCTRMTRDEMEDTVKESRELAEVFRTIADLMERFLPDRGTL